MIVPECSSAELYLIVTTINHLKFFFLFLELWLDCLEKKSGGLQHHKFTITNTVCFI